MSDFTRKIINSLLPEGSAWNPAFQEGMDLYFAAQADNKDSIVILLRSLAKLRDPLLTPILEELEREYGIVKNASLTEQQRRDFLQAFIFQSVQNGTDEEMQERLTEGGFIVQVHTNDPAVDPLILLDNNFAITCGNPNAVCGNQSAFARRVGGELIVNGDKFRQVPNFTVVCGAPTSVAGNEDAIAGVFDGLNEQKIEYTIPTNPKDWPMVWFIGGDATKDIDGKIISIDNVIEQAELRNEYLKIILKYKPLHTWVVSLVDFV